MQRLVRSALPALLLASAPLAAQAQEPAAADPASAERFRIGFGAGVDLGGFPLFEEEPALYPIGFSNVLVPIHVPGGLRIEPQFGYTSLSSKSDFGSFDSSVFRVGTSVAWSWQALSRTRIYVGPQFGLLFRSAEISESFPDEPDPSSEENSATDWFIGGVLGGEAFLTEGFSLGLETQFNYVSLGQDEDAENERDESLVGTNTLVTARIYFN